MSSSNCALSVTSRGILRMEDEAKKANEKQGIGSILGSEPERSKTAASLRRTLSADMSSKKWLGRHGFTPLKKIPSSESFPVLSSSVTSSSSSSSSSSSLSEGEEDEDLVLGRTRKKPEWSNLIVQTEKQQKEDLERPGFSDIWGSILSQKAEDSSKSSSSLYIPSPVKRSKSSLSQKSLEICTESLGSETGSDGFSSYPSSETSELEDKSAEGEQSNKETKEVSHTEIVEEKMEFSETRKSPTRSFPPPLPSLSRREGPGVLMRSHRTDGRLVLEAVPVSSYNYFHSERQSGRLLLSFIKNPSEELMETDDEEEEEELEVEKEVEADVFDEFGGFDEEEETEKVQNRGIVTEVVKTSQPTVMVPCEVIGVHRSAAILTNKLMGLSNKNPTWSQSYNKNIKLLEMEEEEAEEEEEEEEIEEEEPTLPQSLPCLPRLARLIASPATAAAAAASFNAYDYFWRAKPSATAAAAMNPTQEPLPAPLIVDNNNNLCYYPNKLHQNKNKSNNNNKSVISKEGLKHQEQQKKKMVLRGNEADRLVPPVIRGCKEQRKSLLIWQPPRCIATS
ncbi:protein FAF-like, chloroplastic [Macadamia integrifolia]|uniref:protein FAF-like, chloroplastic n=1 Tax=Macadamia integrifolia TaxID=60698 RepID=UPI001C4E81A4|nr:protein FAF-like, chloroplastic [Macadamia integrifolia]